MAQPAMTTTIGKTTAADISAVDISAAESRPTSNNSSNNKLISYSSVALIYQLIYLNVMGEEWRGIGQEEDQDR